MRFGLLATFLLPFALTIFPARAALNLAERAWVRDALIVGDESALKHLRVEGQSVELTPEAAEALAALIDEENESVIARLSLADSAEPLKVWFATAPSSATSSDRKERKARRLAREAQYCRSERPQRIYQSDVLNRLLVPCWSYWYP